MSAVPCDDARRLPVLRQADAQVLEDVVHYAAKHLVRVVYVQNGAAKDKAGAELLDHCFYERVLPSSRKCKTYSAWRFGHFERGQVLGKLPPEHLSFPQ